MTISEIERVKRENEELKNKLQRKRQQKLNE
jgi:hypothetical protein